MSSGVGVSAGHCEAQVFWTDFLRSLADRGLRRVKLVIADHHKVPIGLESGPLIGAQSGFVCRAGCRPEAP